jgi:hypothetical protein
MPLKRGLGEQTRFGLAARTTIGLVMGAGGIASSTKYPVVGLEMWGITIKKVAVIIDWEM